MTAPQLVEPAERRLVGSGAYSIRLADLDTRLDQLFDLEGEHAKRLGGIAERLDRIERVTNESNSALTTLMESIRRHPLLSKFIGSR
jgi:hypothetical protein